jgi:succinyl-diaminopimelate desuccinylase
VTPTDLVALTAELVATPSVSRAEGALADRVEAELAACGWLAVTRYGDSVLARTEQGRPLRVVVAGHLDTVAPAGNGTSRRAGDVVWGVGAADMKGGLAVMLDLATTLAEPALDLTWCFYPCEEVDRAENGLRALWAEHPELLAADAAILGEPTSSRVEAGCQGTLRARLDLTGVRAHTARPFMGRNAIHRLAPALDRVAAWPGRSVVLDGCEFTEQLQVVGISGGVANNVVPDAASMTLNYRYAPDRTGGEARGFLTALFDGLVSSELGDGLAVLDQSDGAPPELGHPVLAALVAATGAEPTAKVGWTDVASFWAHGVPAANFGPGDPLLAHHPDEHVGRHALEQAHSVLAGLFASGVPGA